MNPMISVVVPTFNRSGLLEKCLDSLKMQSLKPESYEILVVDDGSTDGTTDLLRERKNRGNSSLSWFQRSHAGPSAARNLGLLHARGELIALTDDDCIPDRDWLSALAAEMPADRQCAGIGGPVRRVRDNSVGRYIDQVGLMSSWIENGVVEYLITANAFLRAEAVRKIGGFDNNLGRTVSSDFALGGGEDVDLGYRLRRAGYHLLTTNHGAVCHHHHDSIRGFYEMCWRHGYGSGLLSGRFQEELKIPGLLAVLKRLAQALRMPPAQGAKGTREAIAWRVLDAIQAIAKTNGRRACLRDIRNSHISLGPAPPNTSALSRGGKVGDDHHLPPGPQEKTPPSAES